MKRSVLAAVWGFAEATVWFIVPDVLLTWFAIEQPRRAFRAVVPTIAGALVGGALMWAWGRSDGGTAYAVLDAIPAIRGELIEGVRVALDGDGLRSMVFGAFLGTPYKIYAVAWGDLGGGLAPFLVWSVPARGARFALVTLLVGGLRRAVGESLSLRRRRTVLVAGWVCFYVVYFAIMR